MEKIVIIGFMKYSEKYDLYIDDDLVIYYWNNKLDKLMQRTIFDINGYLNVQCVVNNKTLIKKVHRIIYETFVGEIPDGYEIDHKDTHRNNNSLSNLRCVTHKENCNNPISCIKRSRTMKGKSTHKGIITSEFGRKFEEHFGITSYENVRLYVKEWKWYRRHNNKCRWE